MNPIFRTTNRSLIDAKERIAQLEREREESFNAGVEAAMEAINKVGATVFYVPQRSRVGISQRKSNYVDCLDAVRALKRPIEQKKESE